MSHIEGSIVELSGLVVASHLNGRVGVVERFEEGRFVVSLMLKRDKNEIVRIKEANLRFIPSDSPQHVSSLADVIVEVRLIYQA